MFDFMYRSQGLSESPDFEFEYSDTDKWAAELSGVYVYEWFVSLIQISDAHQ